jgi:predicted enzyme related to lactoylglutathione lyase
MLRPDRPKPVQGGNMDKVTSFEIPADDMKRAQKFLKSVFGWKMEKWHEDYYGIEAAESDRNGMSKEKGAVNGALFQRETKNERPLLVVEVPSIARSLAKVKKAGGKVVSERQEAGEWGWWAEVMDTEGNVFELWEAK